MNYINPLVFSHMGNLAGKSPNEMEVLMETSSTSQWFSVATFDYQTVAGLKPCPMCRLATGLLVSTQKYLITNLTAYRKKLCSTVWGKGEYCNKHGNIAILAIQQGNVAFEASYSDPNNLKLKQSDWALSWDSWPKKDQSRDQKLKPQANHSFGYRCHHGQAGWC